MGNRDLGIERVRGHRGGVIPPHRSLTSFEYTQVFADGLLASAILAAWIVLLPGVCAFWRWLSLAIAEALGLPAVAAEAVLQAGPRIALNVPYLDIPGPNPRVKDVFVAAGAAAVAFAAGRVLPMRLTPLRLFLYLCAFIQATAVVFFAVSPMGLARDLESYLETMMVGGLAIVSLVPVLFAFTYYVLESSLARKAFFTVLCMAHLAVFVPVQYALHAFIVHHASLVALPLLYMMFGLVLDVFVVVAFYAVAVAAIRDPAPGGRPR